MKRSRKIQLALISTIPFALTACTGEPNKTVTSTKSFKGMQECSDANIPTDVCSNAFIQALNEHKRIAPVYSTAAECEADFMEGYCVITSQEKWMPKLGGFQITASGEVPASLANEAANGASGAATIINNGGGSGGGDFLTGLLVGNMLSSGGPRYYSEPVYSHRTSRGDFKESTLRKRIQSGTSFSSSVQSKSGFDYKKADTSMTKKLANRSQGTYQSASSSSKTYGGFGSRASARSSFGG